MNFLNILINKRMVSRIIDPDNLFHKNGYGKGYFKLKKKYNRYQLVPSINGKKVKFWKIVYGADDSEGDQFIPIFAHS